ncbi:MAG: Holliday junction branch migration DNA helicase RuvB [Salinispira sp.]
MDFSYDADKAGDEKIFENHLRPRRLADFQGQKSIKENLKIFIEATRKRGETLDHLFLSGPPGLGKTTLAGIVAQELRVDFRVTAAPVLDKPKDLAGMLTTLEDGSVFFIDEIHRLKPIIEEMLYIAMEDRELDWVIGQGPGARNVRIPLPSFTLIGATTKSGKVASPLYSRFGIDIRIELYNNAELADVIQRSAEILDVSITHESIEHLARCSRGTPRIANRLLRRMRDFADILGQGKIDDEIINEGLNRLDIDEDGLTKQDRDILNNIITNYSGGPVGGETLAISIGESIDTLEDFHEPYLIQQGFLMRTPRGRTVTERAYAHLGHASRSAETDEKTGKAGDNEDQGLLF